MAELFGSYEAEVARLHARNAALQRECSELMAAAAERDLEGVRVQAPAGGLTLLSCSSMPYGSVVVCVAQPSQSKQWLLVGDEMASMLAAWRGMCVCSRRPFCCCCQVEEASPL